MNFYLKQPPFSAVSRLFGAKCSAFWCKMQGILVLNARRFGAKRKAIWCKTQGILVQNARQNAAKCEAISINIRCNGINKTLSNH